MLRERFLKIIIHVFLEVANVVSVLKKYTYVTKHFTLTSGFARQRGARGEKFLLAQVCHFYRLVFFSINRKVLMIYEYLLS